MKIPSFCTLLTIAVLVNGCALFHHQAKTAPTGAALASSVPNGLLNPIVTPDNTLSARVASYNATGRFVILSFPIGQMPKADQTLFLYRAGLKVGEVKVSGPQRDNNIAADLVSGEAQVGDEVRDQ